MTVQKFEYEISSWIGKNEKEALNYYGERGWELVGVVPGKSFDLLQLIYKRPKQ